MTSDDIRPSMRLAPTLHRSTWERLGSPPAKIRAADRLTIGTHQDGRLAVFVVGQDGAVWPISPIRSRDFVGGATPTFLTGPLVSFDYWST